MTNMSKQYYKKIKANDPIDDLSEEEEKNLHRLFQIRINQYKLQGALKLGGSLAAIALVVGGILYTSNIAQQQTSTRSRASVTNQSFYVSPSGNDTNPGTADHPYQSLNMAVSQLAPGDQLILDDGVYLEQLNVSRNGTLDKPISITAQNPGNVVIDNPDPSGPDIVVAGNYVVLDGLTASNSEDSCIVIYGANNRLTNVTTMNCTTTPIVNKNPSNQIEL